MLTKRELLELWNRYNFRPNKRLGQNFLVDKNIKEKIVHYINPNINDTILEIGAGFGELTLDLARKAKKIIAVEKDRRIIDIFKKELLGACENIELVESDFLKIPINAGFTKYVGNLPYFITTPIIEKLLEPEVKAGADIYIMVQREYALRMLSGPGTKDYSSLSLFVRFHTEAEKLMTVARSCFFPVPNVDSIFLRLRRLSEPRIKVRSDDLFFKIIRCAFNKRRKTVLNSLSAMPLDNINKNSVRAVLEKAGIDERTRPEDLSLEEFARLADAFSV